MPNKNAFELNTGIDVTNFSSDRATRIAQLSAEVSRVTRALPDATGDLRHMLEAENKSLIARCDLLLDEVSTNQAMY